MQCSTVTKQWLLSAETTQNAVTENNTNQSIQQSDNLSEGFYLTKSAISHEAEKERGRSKMRTRSFFNNLI